MYGIIYKATNIINGKSYIGQTTKPLEKRIGMHYNESMSHRSNTHFHKALRKYGIDKFKFEILTAGCSQDDLNMLEIKNISYYNTFKNGYNSTKGGDGKSGYKFSKFSKQKLSKSHSGENNYLYGKHHNKSTKNKISIANKGRLVGKKHSSSQKYIIITPCGEEIVVHGLREFCRNYTKEKLHHGNLIKVARGIYKTSKGYICKYYKGEIKNG
jgi:group I intron endonuclease